MTLVALDGTPLVVVGAPTRQGVITSPAALAIILIDAVNEAAIHVGQIFTADGASHTIDTTGSSQFEWRSSTATFANVGTTVKVGLAAVDTTTGPPVRAVNVADVITFDVSKSIIGGSGGITNAWQQHVPDAGSKTIANGDLVAFCVQMTARGGVDAIRVANSGVVVTCTRPSVTAFTGAAYSDAGGLPNAIIRFSDGVYGFFYGGYTASIASTQNWNNASAKVEYGNFLQMPVPAKVYGIVSDVTPSADFDLVLYSDPLGTPVAEKTVSLDSNAVASATGQTSIALFSSPYSATANQPLAAIAKPGASSITMGFKTFFASAHQAAETLGANGYAINRASGAFAAQNANKDRFAIGLLVGAFDAGGGATGYPASRVQLGM